MTALPTTTPSPEPPPPAPARINRLSWSSWAAMGLGLLVGYVICLALQSETWVALIDWPETLEALSHGAQVIGLVVAGAWTYQLFVRQRLGRSRANIENAVDSYALDDGHRLVRVVMQIQNVGNVLLRPPRARIEVACVSPTDQSIRARAAVENRTTEKNWPIFRTIEVDLAGDKFRLEPGETERYPFDVVVDPLVKIVQVHSVVICGDPDAPGSYWDETTLHVLDSSPNSTLQPTPTRAT